MRPLVLLALLSSGCAGFARTGPGAQPAPLEPPQTLTVHGEGRAFAAPDTALVSIGVQALAKSVAEASAEANASMQRVLAVLGEAGIPREDVRTSSYDVSIERRWQDGQPGPITGYRVSTSAEVRVRDLAKLAPVLDRVVAAGSNDVSALRLVKDDPAPEQHRALADAVAKARAKAEVLARAAGVSLGEVVSLSESVGGPVVPLQVRTMATAEARGGAPIAEGELEFTAQVAMVFAIR